jgi:OTU domain-containing protein 5
LNIFQGNYEADNPPIMLSYHYGNHYNSVRDPQKPTAGFGLGLPGLKTRTVRLLNAILCSNWFIFFRKLMQTT